MGWVVRGWCIIICLWVCVPGMVMAEQEHACLTCHANKDIWDGASKQLLVDKDIFESSVHAVLECTACHRSVEGSRHPAEKPAPITSQICTDCHAVTGKLHRDRLAKGGLTCIDCHGSHGIQPIAKQQETCLGCHAHEMNMKLDDGSFASVKVDAQAMKGSVHAGLRCVDCHFGYSSKDHPQRHFKNKRELTLTMTDTCQRCHYDKYSQTLESIHFNMNRKGNDKTPLCVDCHGSHAIQSGRAEKLVSARRCQNCHADIYAAYTTSVHGEALVSDHNQDVPICSDCHTAHTIKDPNKAEFRNNVPEMCGNCHADEKLMKKYGLTTAVLTSYLEDFHGVTLSFYKDEKALRHIAVCTDCHGIHDITPTKGDHAVLLKNNLLTRCQKCHPDATANFPDSWISHYEPDLQRAPLVYLVIVFYKFFIPFMIVGLILQIFLHLWRYAVNR
ncbi:MAG: cytochrome C [Deltaproteobacteria bacterium]|nr:cytochrome C [Deltaproteobacteria bacterium]